MQQPDFHSLTPEVIIPLIEDSLEKKCTNLCRTFTSYINRVYELQEEDGTPIVAKFYRPGRWSKEALEDEHEFLLDLQEDEIPVIAPLKLSSGKTLGSYDENKFFALFPKKGGRNCDEFNEDQWIEIGRLMGRVHAIGTKKKPQDRITLHPEKSLTQHIEYLQKGNFIPSDLKPRFEQLTSELKKVITSLFDENTYTRIHGDCHYANLIYRPGESFYVIDFDDMAYGPAVQDFWMLLPGYREDSIREINLFLEGYETFRDFDRRTLKQMEALRAMRYIHFTTWCAHQVADGGFSRLAPGWGTREYWINETNDLRQQIDRIRIELQNN